MSRILAAAAVSLSLLAGCSAVSEPPAGRGTPAATSGRSVNLTAGFSPDPYTLSVTAGGNDRASARSAACTGYIAGTPDVTLNFTAGTRGDDLYIYAHSAADTTLAVRTPWGTWYCNDDDDFGDTMDPWVTIVSPRSGTYSDRHLRER